MPKKRDNVEDVIQKIQINVAKIEESMMKIEETIKGFNNGGKQCQTR